MTFQLSRVTGSETKGVIRQVGADNVTLGATIGVSDTTLTNPYGYFYFLPTQYQWGNLYAQIQYYIKSYDGRTSTVQNDWIKVTFVNHAPVAYSQTLNAGSANPFTFVVSESDPDENSCLSSFVGTIVTFPSSGTLKDSSGAVLSPSSPKFAGCSLTFSFPTYDWGLPYTSFQWTITDQYGLTSNSATATINIPQQNRPPTPNVNTGPYTMAEDTTLTVNMYATDDGAQSNIACQVTAFPSSGKLINGLDNTQITTGSPVVKPNTANPSQYIWPVIYVPDANKNTDQFLAAPLTYTVSFVDSGGLTSTTSPTVTISVITAVNDPPTISKSGTYSYIQIAATGSYSIPYTGIADVDLVSGDTSIFTASISATLNSGTDSCASSCTSNSGPNNNCSFLSLTSPGSVTVIRTGPCAFKFNGTISTMSTVLSSGVTWAAPNPPLKRFTSDANLLVNLQDNGARGSGGPQNTVVSVRVKIVNSPAFTGPVSAFIGGTAILSMASFAAYKALSKGRYIPEDSDPWEKDQLFDDTVQESPVYGGVSEPIYNDA